MIQCWFTAGLHGYFHTTWKTFSRERDTSALYPGASLDPGDPGGHLDSATPRSCCSNGTRKDIRIAPDQGQRSQVNPGNVSPCQPQKYISNHSKIHLGRSPSIRK